MILSSAEIAELTGYKRRSDQIRWLKARGWVFELGGDGKPKVSRAYAERRLDVKSKAREYVFPFERVTT